MLHCSTSAKSWRLKRRNALLFPHHVGEHVSATLFISFIKRCCHCFQFTSSLMPHVNSRKKKKLKLQDRRNQSISAKSRSCRLALIGVETNDLRLNELVNDGGPCCDYFQ